MKPCLPIRGVSGRPGGGLALPYTASSWPRGRTWNGSQVPPGPHLSLGHVNVPRFDDNGDIFILGVHGDGHGLILLFRGLRPGKSRRIGLEFRHA